jgi:uncharacterized membrane protein
MSSMAGGERQTGSSAEEYDRDQVDFTGLTNALRRIRLLRPPPDPPAEQLALFEPGGARRRPWRRRVAEEAPSPPPEYPPSRSIVDVPARLLLLSAFLAYVALYLSWTFRNYDGHGVLAFDLGIFDQGVWLLSQLKTPFVTVNGRHLFGDHASFILLPFALVYRVLPSAKVLLAAQTGALALGAWPVFLIARDKLRNETLAALLAVAYLLHPVVGWTNLSEDFHPDAFEVPLVLFAVWFLLRHRWVGYWVCVGALLLVKEDVGLLTFALGVYVALRHDRRVGLITCLVSAAYFLVVLYVLIPAFLGAGSIHTGRIPYGGPFGFVGKVLTDPGTVFSGVFTERRGWYVWQLFAPIAFVPFLAPSLLLIASAPLMINLVTEFGYQFDVRYHYSTLILPILFVAAIFGVASAPPRSRRAIVVVVLAASVWCAYLWSPTPFGRVHPVISNPKDAAVASFDRAARLIPRNASVSAFYGYVPQLSHREEIYMFPNPWKASNWGTFKQEGQRLPSADRVQFVIVPVDALGPEDAAVLDSIRDQFSVLYEEEGVQLLERQPSAEDPGGRSATG